ncbi:hypothetical protein [Amycolatopsis sp. H20-H5]|uniref:hypothetical protein n=1 Tax=Amycolatopsis sp. H20-H5 TaxID=3046309 RepID=UPI002DBCF022|nr:hypothetical protein [Amycolatopsis sp. H20-H5]MEC3979695.1 hypothetical protein [Amycolatopsis sp. H20-H5]
MSIIETLGAALGLFLLVLMAAGQVLVELNDRLPVRRERRPRPRHAARKVLSPSLSS